MTSVIKVEHVSKSYTITHEKQRQYATFRDVVTDKIKSLRSVSKPNPTNTKEEFFALKDINFEVQEGDCVGIIGRNGAGKSTLLKVLSRITEPSVGKITIRGRVASLLEVGTGFHPELSGRENIYLNGAILGMSRTEIRKRFDEIVDFAEVEKFLDTPVKRYSSGMYVRLAFSVAAHMEPEILIVDEVLAVGDAQFQKKCLGKMNNVSKEEGRTVLFVSHQMGTIAQLCNKSLLLSAGTLIKEGNTHDIINYYLENGNHQVEKIERPQNFEGNHFNLIYMCDSNLTPKTDYRFDDEIFIKVDLKLPFYNGSLELAMRLIDKTKKAVFTIHEKLDRYYDGNILGLLVSIPPKFLTPGRYSWTICINHPGTKAYDLHDDVLPFSIIETGSDFSRYEGADYGSVFANYLINKL